MLGGRDRNGGGHAGLELQVRVVDFNHRIVGDDILDGNRSVADLSDFASEGAAGESVHDETGDLALLDRPDVRLGNIGIDLHLREVVGDHEEGGSIHARGHGLAHVHVAGDHNAIHGSINCAVGQIDSRAFEGCFFDFNLRFGLVQIGGSLVVVGFGDQLVFEEISGTFRIDLSQFKPRPGVGQIAFGLMHTGLERGGIQLGNDLVGFHL